MIRVIATDVETGKVVFDGRYENIETATDVAHKVQSDGSDDDEIVEVTPTGKRRLTLKAWSGMQAYDDYVDIVNMIEED